ncbi:MAG: polysaccharide deacetylase family protein [Steroidobacteraceae bacterium]
MPVALLYHDVIADGCYDASGFSGPEAARYKLDAADFARHLDKIAGQVSSMALAEITPQTLGESHAKPWLITFDDGGISAATTIATMLEKRGWRGVFFFATDYVDTPSFCTRSQIRELHERGHVIGSHSCSHPLRMSDCSWQELCDEWNSSSEMLSDITGQRVVIASVPGGSYSRRVASAAAAAGITVLFNSEPTTDVQFVDGCTVVGRYNVYRGMDEAEAAKLVSSPLRRWRQTVYWNTKKVAKNFAGPIYRQLRKRVLTKRYPAAHDG